MIYSVKHDPQPWILQSSDEVGSPKFSEAGSGMLVKTVNTSRSSSITFRLTTYDTDITQCLLTPLPSDDTALGHTMDCPE
ncbi:hypothetical protein ACOMHN_062549 [Nucella lapillus]